MLPITFALSGSINQTRPPGPPASGLGSRTYSQPGSGLPHFSISIFEGADARVCVGTPVWPAGAPAVAVRATKPSTNHTRKTGKKDRQRFAFIPCPRNSQVGRVVLPTLSHNRIEPEIRTRESTKQLPCQKARKRSPATHLFSESRGARLKAKSVIGGRSQPMWWFSASYGRDPSLGR